MNIIGKTSDISIKVTITTSIGVVCGVLVSAAGLAAVTTSVLGTYLEKGGIAAAAASV